ncbi:hypothetical protein NL676_033739 [Syzygium grande]|nr:hypothetical protein NL676_033739 [Syzygium grande]
MLLETQLFSIVSPPSRQYHSGFSKLSSGSQTSTSERPKQTPPKKVSDGEFHMKVSSGEPCLLRLVLASQF